MISHGALCALRTDEVKCQKHNFASYINDMDSMGDRLRAARLSAGFESAAEAAERLGVNYTTYAQHENGTRGFPPKRAEMYARVFKVKADWLLFGRKDSAPDAHNSEASAIQGGVSESRYLRAGDKKSSLQRLNITHRVPILGKVEAGAWRTMVNDKLEPDGFIPLDAPEFDGIDLFAYEVSGPSMNEVFREGDRVICQRFRRGDLRNGDFVIIRDTEGALAEITIKEFRVSDKGLWEFWPRSTDHRYKTPLVLQERNDYQQSGAEIIGIVLFIAPSPIRRVGRLVGIKDQV